MVLWQTGRADEAASAFRTAIARRRSMRTPTTCSGPSCDSRGRRATRWPSFAPRLRLRPDYAEAHRSLGQLLQQLGQADRRPAALAEAERLNARKADGQAATFAVAVGLERVKANDLAGAIERFREAVRLAPDNARAHHQLGLALQRAGAQDEAQKHLSEARRLAPYLATPDQSVRR